MLSVVVLFVSLLRILLQKRILLVDFSFPILTITCAVLLNAIHFTLIANGEHQWLAFLRKLCGNIQNWMIYFIHLLLLLCGLISLTQFQREYQFIWLPTIFLPGLLYILLYKFTATSTIRTNLT